jgi:hypothetical protein
LRNSRAKALFVATPVAWRQFRKPAETHERANRRG